MTQRNATLMLLIVACLALGGCNAPMSLDKASQMEPYKSLGPEDRQWLYNYHQTPGGAQGWVEDELRLQDDSLENIWFTSDGLIELESKASKSYSVKRDKVINDVKSKGGAAVAKEVILEAHKRFGSYPNPVQTPYILLGLSENARHAQKLRYPKLYTEAVIMETQKLVVLAQGLHQGGKLPESLKAMGEAIRQRKNELGQDHPATKGAMAMFQEMAGHPYTEADDKNAAVDEKN